MKKQKVFAIFSAIAAAVFYAINMPASKVLLQHIAPTTMAALLYLGAGIGIGILFLFNRKNGGENLSKQDLPYTLGMIVLDIIAPIFLMCGLSFTTSANASLLNNFEIVATSLIALFIFKEMISKRLWIAIVLVTLSSAILSFEDLSSLSFSFGSLFVLLAALCWGLENNCTRKISSKNTYQIVMLKGVFSGIGSFLVARVLHEPLPAVSLGGCALVLGFVAYGLSLFFYIKAQSVIGAAKTSAYYAIAPFVGAFLSFLILKEPFTSNYLLALVIMLTGSLIIVLDTLAVSHAHVHTHTIVRENDVATVTHEHLHTHLWHTNRHHHRHASNQALHG